MMIAESKTSDALLASGNAFVCRLHAQIRIRVESIESLAARNEMSRARKVSCGSGASGRTFGRAVVFGR